jgi:phosphate transport system substrate-binding protein
LALSAVLGISAALLLVISPGAEAAPPAGTKIITVVGSDTTEDVVESVLVNPDPNGPGDNGKYNITSRYDDGTTEFVPADPAGSGTLCGARTYYTPPTPAPAVGPTIAPNGSSAGRNALRDILNDADATNNGCIDGARSSGGPRTVGATGDRATFEYSAWGIDFITWSTASLNAPTEMTVDEIRKIYNCTFDDWSDVGGAPGPIQRVLPQPGSGSRDFWTGTVLGFDPTAFTTGTCPQVVATRDDGGPLNEHAGIEVPVAYYQTAIFPYSSGQWVFQANNSINPTLDKRNGFRVGQITPVVGNGAAPAAFTGATTSGSTTLSSSPLTTNRFTNVNIGATVSAVGVPGGTTITAVAPNGQTATMSAPATATGTPSVTLSDMAPVSPVRWNTIFPGGWLPNTPVGAGARGPVNEAQIALNNTNTQTLNARYVFNVVDSLSPQYVEARALLGFNNVALGVKSSFCDGTESTKILDGGFAPLSPTTPASVPASRNLAGSTCRAFTP